MNVNEYYISFFDILILIPLGWSVYKGFFNGAIVEALSLSFLLLSIYAYIRIVEMPGRLVSKEVAETLEYLPLVLFIIVFSVIVFLSNVLERFVSKHTAGVAMPPLNRFLGISFSLIKYIFIISGFLIFIDKLDERYNMLSDEDTYGSIFYNRIINVTPTVYPYLSFDNIKNTRYINIVKKASIKTVEGRIPIGQSLQTLKGLAGSVSWTSYQSPHYKDNHDLIIVEAIVENQDGKMLQTGVFRFLLAKRKKNVKLYSYQLNGVKKEKVKAYATMKNGTF